MRRSLSLALAVLSSMSITFDATASGSSVRPPSTEPSNGPSQPSSPWVGGSLTAALDTISSDEIRADIFFIASDELEGRDTISPGQRVTARFIRSRLERLGIAPGGPKGGYFYEYPLSTMQLRAKESFARFTQGESKQELELGRDYFFSASAPTDLVLEGPVVFCGKGSKSDLAKAELAGKWALLLDDGGLIGSIETALIEQKALGLLLTPTDDFKDKPYEEKFSRSMQTLTNVSARWPTRESEKKGNSSFAIMSLTRAAAAKLSPLMAERDQKLPKAGTVFDGTFSHTRKFQGDGGTVMAENVCGFVPGTHPTVGREVIIISAHYDHVGWGPRKDAIHNGADDNGSGTTGLLALAEALSVHGPMNRSVLLMWVSGEEKGLWGSKAWTENPYLPEGYVPWCNLNIDMIGRNAPDKLLITPTSARKEYNGLVKLAEEVAPLEGFPTLGSCDAYWDRSDHANFASKLKLPVAFLFSDVHEDYHKPSDDPEKIDYDKIRRVARTVFRMIDGLQVVDLKL